MITVSSGEDGTLDAPCLDDGSCLVDNAYCNQKVCKCQTEYFDKMGECGTHEQPECQLNVFSE